MSVALAILGFVAFVGFSAGAAWFFSGIADAGRSKIRIGRVDLPEIKNGVPDLVRPAPVPKMEPASVVGPGTGSVPRAPAAQNARAPVAIELPSPEPPAPLAAIEPLLPEPAAAEVVTPLPVAEPPPPLPPPRPKQPVAKPAPQRTAAAPIRAAPEAARPAEAPPAAADERPRLFGIPLLTGQQVKDCLLEWKC